MILKCQSRIQPENKGVILSSCMPVGWFRFTTQSEGKLHSPQLCGKNLALYSSLLGTSQDKNTPGLPASRKVAYGATAEGNTNIF